MTRLHPLTSLALLVAVFVPFVVGEGLLRTGMLLMALAYGFTLFEFKKYTSWYQFIVLVALGTGMGLLLDVLAHHSPLMTVALFLVSLATVMRQAFMHRFTYVNHLWVDPLMLLLSLSAYLLAERPPGMPWEWWFLPLLPMVAGAVLIGGYVQDGRLIRRKTSNGYRIKVGMEAPEIELPDHEGQPVRLSEEIRQHPVLLIFVRGDWCPGCHMMLRTYEQRREAFHQKGIHVLAIGPDSIAVNRDMVERIGVGYRLLSDTDQAISTMYGVVYDNPVLEAGVSYAEGIPLPAAFLVDMDGRVRYVSRPDRVGEFLDPARIFDVLVDMPDNGQLAWT